jgi:transposase
LTLQPSSTVPVIEAAAALEERLIKMVEIERIRYAHFREGTSIRELARALHHSRTTIRRALEDSGPWTYRRTRRRPGPVMDRAAPIVAGWLAADEQVHHKQRHTAHRIYERLRDEHGFAGGESTVRAFVRGQRRASLRGVTIPLAHDPGAEAQVDFGEARARIAGVETVVALFCARLAHSTRDVVVAYPAENRAAWFDGHVVAFETWGGAPAAIWYDNPSGLGSFRAGTFHPAAEFLALQSAYRFRAHHCTPGEGHEKGLVEGLVGYARRTYLVPIPEVASFDELNERLARETAAEERRCRARQTQTVGERFAAERPLLAPLPVRPFLACTRHPVRASAQALVAFDGSRYSVPVRHEGAALWLRAYATTVEIWTATMKVASHPRAFTKGTLTTDFWHYLPALVRKPGAFANAIPVRQAVFPPEPAALLEALETAHVGDQRRAHREFLAACALSADVEPVRWRAACATALARGEASAAGVRAALAGTSTAGSSTLALPARLAGVAVPAGDIGQYSRLLGVRS